MNCKWIEQHLSDIVDGLLTPEEQAEVEAHLDVCADCSMLVTASQQDMILLQGLGNVPVPVDLKQRIAESLAKPKTQKNPWRFFLPRFAPVAAAVLISVLSINTVPGYMASRETKEAQLDAAPRMGVMAAPEADPTTEGVATYSSGEALAKSNDTEDMRLTLAAVDEKKPSLWVVTSAAGSSVLLLWGAVVLRWYKKVQ